MLGANGLGEVSTLPAKHQMMAARAWLGTIAAASIGATASTGWAPSPSSPPAQLACLSRWYAIQPVRDDAGWAGLLADGARVPWDDGMVKGFDAKLDAPDLEDTYSIPYRSGRIVPVTVENDDPGRIRVDALFRATYGATEAEVRQQLVTVNIAGQRLLVHRKVRVAFERVGARLDALVAANPALKPFLEHLSGTFVWRPIAGTTRQSAHSYGVSLDLNAARSTYWRWQKAKGAARWQNRLPQEIVDAFEAEGFIWGGRWFHYDTMHFEYRPELLDPRCRASPSSVPSPR